MLYQLSYTRMPVVGRTSRDSSRSNPSAPIRAVQLTTYALRLTTLHGGGRIRTYVGQSPADLQSATISHSVTPPSLRVTLIRDRTPPATKRGPGRRRCRRHRADEGNRTPNLPLTRRVLCRLSYVSLEQAENKTDPYHRGQVGLSQWGGFPSDGQVGRHREGPAAQVARGFFRCLGDSRHGSPQSCFRHLRSGSPRGRARPGTMPGEPPFG